MLLVGIVSFLLGIEAGLWVPVWLGIGVGGVAGWLSRSLLIAVAVVGGTVLGAQWLAHWQAATALENQAAAIPVHVRSVQGQVRAQWQGVPVAWRANSGVEPGDAVTVHCSTWKIRQQGTLLAQTRPRLTCDSPTLHSHQRAAGWRRWFVHTREQLVTRLLNVLPPPVGELAVGFVLGDDSWLPESVQEDFRVAGTTHVLALSGYNVSILAALLMAWLPTLVGVRPASAIVVLVLIGFCFLTGAPGSLVRATVMGGAVLLAKAVGRGVSGLRALWLAVLGLLIVSPSMSLDIGFALSVTATAGLLVTPSTNAWLSILLTPLSATAATLPVIVGTFGRLSLISPLANILITPFTTPLFLGSLLITLLTVLVPPLVPLLTPALSFIGSTFISIIHWCATQPWAQTTVPAIPLVALLLPISWMWLLIRRRRTCRQCQCAPVPLIAYGLA